jgi:cytochrome P450
MSTANTGPVVLDPSGRDIPGEAERLRELGPVVQVELPGGILAWAVTRHELLKQIILDPQVSRDGPQHWRLWPEVARRPEWAWIGPWVATGSMLHTYGIEHTRLRKLVAGAFTHRQTEALRPKIEHIAAGLLDGLAATPAAQPVDLQTAYAHPLPMQVICELFGVPDAMRPDVAGLIERIIDTTATAEQAAETNTLIGTVLSALIAHRRDHPGTDLTTALIAARDDGDKLDDRELLGTLLLFIGAGHETTVNLIGNAVHALLTHPDELSRVRAGEIGWDQVIDETLRWAPSIANLPLRFAVTDIKAGDVTIRAGDAILAGIAAANRDPARYEHADRFDPTRDARDHLAFGFGVHRCIGAPLARIEAGTALPALFDRFPDLHLATAPERLNQVPSFIAYGWRPLPVHLMRGH